MQDNEMSPIMVLGLVTGGVVLLFVTLLGLLGALG